MLTLLIFSGIAVALFAQAVILPGVAADEVRHFPPYEPYRVPLLAAGIAFIACAQVSLAALWMLVLRAQAGTFFRPGAQRWMVTIGAAVGVATLLTSGFFLYLTFVGIPMPDQDMGDRVQRRESDRLQVLDCQPGDVLRWVDDGTDANANL